MSFINRTIILCTIKGLQNQENQRLCFIPELHALQYAIKGLNEQQLTQTLRNHKQTLAEYEAQYGLGIIPLKTKASLVFIENLFNEALANNIPLPVNILENDLKYHIKNLENANNNVHMHEKRVRIAHRNLSFFAKYLPYVGTLMTYGLTLGFTLMSYKTLLNWAWSFSLIALFCLSKLLTNYADISGGPERRLQMLGSWIDRQRTGAFKHYDKFSLPLLLVSITTIAILGCSSILTWYAAWEILCTIKAIAELPSVVSFIMAGVFAGFSTGSTFGRIYNDLYQLVYRKGAHFVSFDNVREANKLDIDNLNEKLKSNQNLVSHENLSTQIEEQVSQGPSILHQFNNPALATNDATSLVEKREKKALTLF